MSTVEEMNDQSTSPGWLMVFSAWLVATTATLGALFMSQVMDIAPCVLCWYQRIFMFPLVILLPLGLFPFDRRIVRYALPLGLLGLAVAVFHLLLIAGVIPEEAVPCRQGIPCKAVQISWFGFVTIPMLSALAFAVISALLALSHFRSKQ